ncbi:sodium/proton antiporter NhaB [Luteithermobacter gelatinilyticus]|uniref:sodium/proton antiporter NhaB n=1 Tax=Luteithermobacter gelatinilyticus TaxID=2582913 RepID=UPI0011070B88|nr:sodium/proton antiporter NhaB [Luteithermobacter gelatinilyticus]|tara:strand:+ start:13392 stop:15008 length:1617 start_codon:yes stop_codon:yes gene_type:complete
MVKTISQGMVRNFMGHSPEWYKLTIIGFLILNPMLYIALGPETGSYIVGWILVLEFIFTLAMALKCYPLIPGGLLALEALFMGLTSPTSVYHEIEHGLEVILLLVFMVAGIYFMQGLLLFTFTKVLLKVRSKVLLSFLFSFMAAVLSAFLDALTVTAVVITVAVGFYSIYHKVASGKTFHHEHDHSSDHSVQELHRSDLEQFRAFLRSLMMHAAVGTALGGVCTIVGEPQNLIIGSVAGWSFVEFFIRMAPVSLPVLVSGLITCMVLEKIKIFGYGTELPVAVRNILEEFDAEQSSKRTLNEKASLIAQAVVAGWLVIGLMFHLAAVGLIGLSVIVLLTAFNGVTEEHQIGKAFEEGLPFTSLLVVFFAVVAVINDQELFRPVIDFVLSMDTHSQIAGFYIANGVLSAISDNVFVATVYIKEIKNALDLGQIARDSFDLMAVAINTGTNIPSVATPNGQAAFLFLLTSALAPLIRLSYVRMVIMALPYTIVMTLVGLIAVLTVLEPATDYMYEEGLIQHHSEYEASHQDENAKGATEH